MGNDARFPSLMSSPILGLRRASFGPQSAELEALAVEAFFEDHDPAYTPYVAPAHSINAIDVLGDFAFPNPASDVILGLRRTGNRIETGIDAMAEFDFFGRQTFTTAITEAMAVPSQGLGGAISLLALTSQVALAPSQNAAASPQEAAAEDQAEPSGDITVTFSRAWNAMLAPRVVPPASAVVFQSTPLPAQSGEVLAFPPAVATRVAQAAPAPGQFSEARRDLEMLIERDDEELLVAFAAMMLERAA